MLTAKEARAQLSTLENKKFAIEQAKIEEKIKNAIAKGDSVYYTDGYLIEPTVKWLIDLGYKVTKYDSSDPRDNYTDRGHTIKW